jgi:hypothetical protein
VASHLDHEDRLAARRGAQGAHEAARLADALDIDQDALRLRIGGEVVENLAEVDIGRRAHRHHAGKTDVVGRRPVEDGGTQGARLRHQRQVAGLDAAVEEGCIEPETGTHDAQTVGADDAHAVGPGGSQHFALKLGAPAAGLAEAGGQHHRRTHPMFAAGLDDGGHGFGTRADHRQLDRLADFLDRGVTALPLHLLVPRIDRIQLAPVAAFQHVAQHDAAHRAGTFTGADHGHRLRRKQHAEVMKSHGLALLVG